MTEPVYEVFGYLSARQYITTNEENYLAWNYRGYTLEVVRDVSLGYLKGSIDLNGCPFDFDDAVEVADKELHNGVVLFPSQARHQNTLYMQCDGLQDIRPYSLHYPTSQKSSKSYKTFVYVKRNLEQTVDKILEELWC